MTSFTTVSNVICWTASMKKSNHPCRPKHDQHEIKYDEDDDEPPSQQHHHRGSNEELFQLLQSDLYISLNSNHSRSNHTIDSYHPIQINEPHSNHHQCALTQQQRMQPQHHEYVMQRRKSLLSTLEDAETINALNPLQKRVAQLLNACDTHHGGGKRWKPPSYELDLTNDGHSFLLPKLFHSKKLLDSNVNKYRQKKKKIKKKGPQEIGKMKGFHSPEYSESVLKDNDETTFLDRYRSWYPSSTNSSVTSGSTTRHESVHRDPLKRNPTSTSKYSKKRKSHINAPNRAKKNKQHRHSRWGSSNTACIRPLTLKRLHSTNSTKSCQSQNNFQTNTDLEAYDIRDLSQLYDNDEESDEHEDGMVYVHDYPEDLSRASSTNTTTSSSWTKRQTKSARFKSSQTKRYWNWNAVDFLEEKSNSTRKNNHHDCHDHHHKHHKPTKYEPILPKFHGGKKTKKKRSKTADMDHDPKLRMSNIGLTGFLSLRSSTSDHHDPKAQCGHRSSSYDIRANRKKPKKRKKKQSESARPRPRKVAATSSSETLGEIQLRKKKKIKASSLFRLPSLLEHQQYSDHRREMQDDSMALYGDERMRYLSSKQPHNKGKNRKKENLEQSKRSRSNTDAKKSSQKVISKKNKKKRQQNTQCNKSNGTGKEEEGNRVKEDGSRIYPKSARYSKMSRYDADERYTNVFQAANNKKGSHKKKRSSVSSVTSNKSSKSNKSNKSDKSNSSCKTKKKAAAKKRTSIAKEISIATTSMDTAEAWLPECTSLSTLHSATSMTPQAPEPIDTEVHFTVFDHDMHAEDDINMFLVIPPAFDSINSDTETVISYNSLTNRDYSNKFEVTPNCPENCKIPIGPISPLSACVSPPCLMMSSYANNMNLMQGKNTQNVSKSGTSSDKPFLSPPAKVARMSPITNSICDHGLNDTELSCESPGYRAKISKFDRRNQNVKDNNGLQHSNGNCVIYSPTKRGSYFGADIHRKDRMQPESTPPPPAYHEQQHCASMVVKKRKSMKACKEEVFEEQNDDQEETGKPRRDAAQIKSKDQFDECRQVFVDHD